jgi:hypothetical protein
MTAQKQAMTAADEPQAPRYKETDTELFSRLKSWYTGAMQRQAPNRYQMAVDVAYYDSEQHTPEEIAELRRRGQPIVVYNEVKPTVDWMIGTERRMRRDFSIVSRHDDSDDARKNAEVKTALLKYLDDVNREPFERSQAVNDMLKAGVGWLEVGIRYKPEPDEEPIYTGAVPWTDVIYDDLARRPDGEDDRFRFRFKEVDLDWALGVFPERFHEQLRRAAESFNDGNGFSTEWIAGYPTSGYLGDAAVPAKWMQFDASSWLNNPRKRLLMIECWHKEYSTGKRKMHVTLMTEHDLIITTESPYKHGKFPFIPYWAYRRGRDGAPYGPIRPVRGPQDSLNKRMSKALFALSVNQLRVEEGAIDDEIMTEEELREEAAAPDGILKFAKGALSGNRVQVREHSDIAVGHMQLAERDSVAIRNNSGVTGESRGMDTNANSGKAVLAKQEQGSMVTAELFDNILLAHQMEGEIKLSLIEQFMTQPKVFSVVGERRAMDYYRINQWDEQAGKIINDVTAIRCAYVIGEQPWKQSLAEAAFESMMTMMGQIGSVAPQVVINILDLVFEWSNLPGKGEIVRRIRQVNGQGDPDEGETPEQAAAKAKQAQLADAQMQAQFEQLMADVAEAKARGQKVTAEAMKTRLTAIYEAAQAAQVAVTIPHVMPVADQLLKSAGFIDQDGGQVAQVPEQQAAPMAPQPQAPALPQLQQADGAQAGIETMAPDGVEQGAM